jgi:hypothetical protein
VRAAASKPLVEEHADVLREAAEEEGAHPRMPLRPLLEPFPS